MPAISSIEINPSRKADWEVDFYSRPILESDGKKRWELLITSSEELSGATPFQWEQRCPAGEVNSLWLTNALKEAIEEANKQGWETPLRIRSWRSSMKTMIRKAAEKLGLEVIASRRTYALQEWLAQREREVYPNQEGYLTGPLAPTISPPLNQPLPLPEAVRGDAWSIAYIPLGVLKEAEGWPMEFSGLLPIPKVNDENIPIPGLRLFSKSRALALAGWLGGLEPVKLVIEGNQLLLEAGQEDRWLVSDLRPEIAKEAQQNLMISKEKANGLQFISIQTSPEEEYFAGFWMLKDLSL